MRRFRVLLADDHPHTLEGMRAFLEPHFECVGTAKDGRAAIEEALRLKPDLAVLDISMPLLNGIDAAIQVRKNLPGIKLLFVTGHSDPAYLEAALNAGGSGYVLKSAAREELLEAARTVLAGKLYITPKVSTENLECARSPKQAAATLRLSARERETLQLVAEGRSAKEIAHILTISIKTVAFHRENIKRKLGLRSVAELTRHALEQRLV